MKKYRNIRDSENNNKKKKEIKKEKERYLPVQRGARKITNLRRVQWRQVDDETMLQAARYNMWARQQ